MLEKEYNFWLMQRARPFYDESENEKFQFFQYRAHMKTPRPESYREDMDLVRNITSDGLFFFKR